MKNRTFEEWVESLGFDPDDKPESRTAVLRWVWNRCPELHRSPAELPETPSADVTVAPGPHAFPPCRETLGRGVLFGVIERSELRRAKDGLSPIRFRHVEDAELGDLVALLVPLNVEEEAAWERFWRANP